MTVGIQIYQRRRYWRLNKFYNNRGELLNRFLYKLKPREKIKLVVYDDIIIDINIYFERGEVSLFEDFKIIPGNRWYYFIQGKGNIPELIDTPEIFQ